MRECTVCHQKETEEIPKLKASADNNEKQPVPETVQQPAKGTTQQETKEQGQQVVKEPTTNVKKPAAIQKKVAKVKKVKPSKKKVTIKKGDCKVREQETYEVNNTNRENQKLDSETAKILIANMLKFFLFLILVKLIITLHMMVFETPRETEKTVVVDDSTVGAR